MKQVIISNLDPLGTPNKRLKFMKTETSVADISDVVGAVADLDETLEICLTGSMGVNCTGAIDSAGVFETYTEDDVNGGKLVTSEKTVNFNSIEDLDKKLNEYGVDLIELGEGDFMRLLKPRAIVPMLDGFIDSLTEQKLGASDYMTITIKSTAKGSITHTGSFYECADMAAGYGILINLSYDALRLGTYPGSGFCEVEVRFKELFVNTDPYYNYDWMDDSFRNEMTKLYTNGFDTKVMWDGVPEFWFFNRTFYSGANGELGDTVSLNVSNRMIDGFTLNPLVMNNDYTNKCSAAGSPVICRQLNQISEFDETFKDDLLDVGLRLTSFNQDPVISIKTSLTGYNPVMVTAKDYRHAVTLLPVDTHGWGGLTVGYVIPQPEMAM